MPVMDGREAVKMIGVDKDPCCIPVIVLTASALKGDQDTSAVSGFNGYLRNPISRAELFQELVRFLPYSEQETEPEQIENIAQPDDIPADILVNLPETIE